MAGLDPAIQDFKGRPKGRPFRLPKNNDTIIINARLSEHLGMPDPEENSEERRKWLLQVLPRHDRLAAGVSALLEGMLRKKRIEYLSVTRRVKTLDGAIEKISRKEYRNPEVDLTDLSGIRVITYLEEQVEQISKVIKELFEVDAKNSHDRAETLGDDRVGYRSTHFVCKLGKQRAKLPENEALGDLKFEIQVRTVLQHAWAELAHDRSFKFGAPLPRKIQRKLNLFSGMLEVVDDAFDEISKEIDAYKVEIQKSDIKTISDIEVDSISIPKFLAFLASKLDIEIEGNASNDTFREMKTFGIKTIGDLEKIATSDFINAHKSEFKKTTTATGALRRLMAYHDLERYIETKPTFRQMIPLTFNMLSRKYDADRIRMVLHEAGISTPSRNGE